MNSTLSKQIEDSSHDENLSDMSPVTDLTLNLKSLKTTSSGTPTRRISWSDPFKSVGTTKDRDECSPSTDSPMLDEILMKNTRRIKKTVSRKLLSMDNVNDKENVPPNCDKLGKSFCSENEDINDSQDSGYSSASNKHITSVICGSTPRLSVKSSLFTNIEDIDGLFPMDEDSNMEPEAESCVSSLLTKPLCDIGKGTITDGSKKVKLPIRRCLTMEMDINSETSSMELDTSQCGMYVSHSILENHSNTHCSSTDLEPLPRLPFKRPDPNTLFGWQSKRRKSSPSVNLSESDHMNAVDFVKQRSFSETAATIMQAVQRADLQPDLIGDCSRCYALPMVRGRHQDLKCISPETLIQVMRGDFNEKIDGYTLVDCRYPYEFEGGHIQGAQNIYTKEEIIETFLNKIPEPSKKNVIIFHCEFSSERAPNLCRFLRNKDREVNECKYPKLHHPEIYLLDGGYKAFFANYREYCEPREYKPMNHKDHSSELRLFRAKSKSWGADSKTKYKMKSSSENANV